MNLRALGIRFVSHTRAGYPGSARSRGQPIVDVVADAATVLDPQQVEPFVSRGHCGRGSRHLALDGADARCVGALP